MNKEEARLLLMDYVYGELDEAKKTELLSFIDQHDDLKQEFEEITDTQSFLHHLPVQNPAEQLVIMEPKNASGEGFWESILNALTPRNSFAQAGFGVAVLAFVFIVTGAITGLNLSYSETGVQLGFGKVSEAEKSFSAAQVEQIVQQIQRDNVALVQQVVADAQEQQNIQLEETFASFASYLEGQRTNDLQLISSGLEDLKENTFTRFRQNEQVLGEIIQTVSYGN
jgi:anti-sigma factor RsiW